MTASTTLAIGYIRTATRASTETEHAKGSQLQRIQQFCVSRQFHLLASFTDSRVFGTILHRDGLQAALDMLTNGNAEVLITVNLSRLTRSAALLATLLDAYFGDGTHGLIAIDEALDTRSAQGQAAWRFLCGVSCDPVEGRCHA